MVLKEQLRYLVIQQKTLIEKGGYFVERSIYILVLAALNDNQMQ